MRKHDMRPSISGDPMLRLLSLFTCFFLAALLVFFPRVAADRWGVADPIAAGFMLWSMVAGLVSGLGLELRLAGLRAALSSEACLLALVLSLLRMAGH